MSQQLYRQEFKVKGNFKEYVRLRLYAGTGPDGDTTLTELGPGRWEKKCDQVELPLPSTLCTLLGLSKRFTVRERIKVGQDYFECVVKSPKQFRSLVHLTERLTVKPKGAYLIALLEIDGQVSVPFMFKSQVERAYIDERISYLKKDLSKAHHRTK